MRSLYIVPFILLLSACDSDTRQPVYPKNRNLSIKVIQGDYDYKNINMLCIDGIKYIVTEQGGIAPKWQSWQDVDPTVEECD